MNIQQAIDFVVKFQKTSKTDRSITRLVRDLWGKLGLSQKELEILAQQALATRISTHLTGGKDETEYPTQPEYAAPKLPSSIANKEIVVSKDPVQVKTVALDIRILYNTNYDVAGKRKPFANFTVYDLDWTINRYAQQVDGHQRHLEFMRETKARLLQLGKKSISELATGEQTILARKFSALKKAVPNIL